MSTTNYDYWPFFVSDADAADPEIAEKVAFLKAASEAGSESYRFGINNYGAKTEHRSGVILERGRRRWEIRLYEHDDRCFSAFVTSFTAAGNAVNSWLERNLIVQILGELMEHLVVPPGLKDSYTIYEEKE